ncbi:hypothetical protein [Caulobacter sp. NIBR1757]|uniref:hypothetical protein n=1 Tax=Caulobacter sp. NIBR1757 TaxID=3016000 RepID=UPI0022F133C4|nr:hypothetical protein [Caulobacter sp. NIBR1757]WGM40703.1 hypothetical protein AMEJIAPC_03650 [Caulobacter sp. NIBR1757]
MVAHLDAPTPSRAAPWISDFAWENGRLRIRKTDIKLSLNGPVLAEIAAWALWLALLWPVAFLARQGRRQPLAIWFAPERPRPWYLVRAAAMWAGIDVARRPEEADAAFYFDDVTVGLPESAGRLRGLNFGCADVSKSHVAAVFEAVFGYPLSVDPMITAGPIVEKSEKNGVHDGRIVEGPLAPRPGHVYQKLIDTADRSGACHDLRTPCAGGAPVLVWTKLKPAGRRFAIQNRRATLHAPAEVFSPRELALIVAFNARMGADWGGLDILRDRQDGRIYIVDVNKTDLGPLIALSWIDKIRSMSRLAVALERLVCRG